MERFDVIAIGGGTAGLVTAAGAAALGLRTALIERDALGGDCLWTGCVPSKALIASARLAHQMRHADRLGLTGAAPAHAFRAVMERMRAARARVAVHDDPERFRGMGVEVVQGWARITAHGEVSVDGRRLAAKHLVIATGAEPAVPPIAGLADAGYLTYATAFDQNVLPRRIALLGGGPIGLEFAQLYRRLGAEVTVLEMLPQLLPREEPDAARVVQHALECEGIVVHTGARVVSVTVAGDGTKVVRAEKTGEAIEVVADEIFVATGRRAAAGELGLERLDVQVERGAVRVDRALRAGARGVWAAGDAAGGPQFTHVAEYHAKLVLRNIVSPIKGRVDYGAVPAVTYTDPEVACVGLTEAETRERHGGVDVYRYDFADLDRAIVDGHTEGFVKVVTTGRGRIAGATVVASGAGELLQPLVLALKHGLALPKLAGVVYPYPTMVEGVKRTADSYYRRNFTGWKAALVRRVARWLA